MPNGLKPIRHWRKVDTIMANIEILVDEGISKRETWGESSGAERRLPVCLAVLPHALVKVRIFLEILLTVGGIYRSAIGRG